MLPGCPGDPGVQDQGPRPSSQEAEEDQRGYTVLGSLLKRLNSRISLQGLGDGFRHGLRLHPDENRLVVVLDTLGRHEKLSKLSALAKQPIQVNGRWLS